MRKVGPSVLRARARAHAQESARNRAEQRRKFHGYRKPKRLQQLARSPQRTFQSESLRGPPILIRIPIFNSSEVAKIPAGRKRCTGTRNDIQDIDWRRLLAEAAALFSARKRVTTFRKGPREISRRGRLSERTFRFNGVARFERLRRRGSLIADYRALLSSDLPRFRNWEVETV